jgi:hypothetical protein
MWEMLLGLTPEKCFQAGMADGRVVRVPPTVSEKSLLRPSPRHAWTSLDPIGRDSPRRAASPGRAGPASRKPAVTRNPVGRSSRRTIRRGMGVNSGRCLPRGQKGATELPGGELRRLHAPER